MDEKPLFPAMIPDPIQTLKKERDTAINLLHNMVDTIIFDYFGKKFICPYCKYRFTKENEKHSQACVWKESYDFVKGIKMDDELKESVKKVIDLMDKQKNDLKNLNDFIEALADMLYNNAPFPVVLEAAALTHKHFGYIRFGPIVAGDINENQTDSSNVTVNGTEGQVPESQGDAAGDGSEANPKP